MSKRAARLALVFALLGLGASATAAYVHYHLLYDPHYTSFCDVSETVSCSQVYLSRFSTFAGVPVALFAGIWFMCAALLSVGALVGREEVRDSIPGYLFAGSTMALAATLYLLYVSAFVLKTYCPVCLTIDAAVIGLFLVSGSAISVPMTTLPQRFARDLRVLVGNPLAIAVTVLFVAGGLGILVWVAGPYLASFFASPATWISAFVEWGIFLITTLQAVAQAGSVLLDVIPGFLSPFAWMVLLSAFAGISLLWSVSLWRFVRVPRGR